MVLLFFVIRISSANSRPPLRKAQFKSRADGNRRLRPIPLSSNLNTQRTYKMFSARVSFSSPLWYNEVKYTQKEGSRLGNLLSYLQKQN